jgi:hypothetical protein
MRYGLLDTVDRVWMGDQAGPRTYEDLGQARLAAEVCAFRLGWPVTRVRAVIYDAPATVKRDDVDAVRTSDEAERYLDDREAGR